MLITVASGKGGTGKTTVAAGLAKVWDRPRIAVDFDVEAPNLHLFLTPDLTGETVATLPVPRVVPARCNGCEECREICPVNAILVFGAIPMVYADLCIGCGGCLDVCPVGALQEDGRELGRVSWGATLDGIRYAAGRSRIGETKMPPLIRHVRRQVQALLTETPADVIVDAPPGTSCPAVEAVLGADLVLLVTEPTPFGLHDLKLAVEAFQGDGRRLAVVVNRAGVGDHGVHAYCTAAGLPILAELPFERSVAEAYAAGRTLDTLGPVYRQRLEALRDAVRALVWGEGGPVHA